MSTDKHYAGSIDYKRMYEGSQRSLQDMAAKQATALGRVNKLREGVLAALKQHFPTEFAQAEAALGKRLSSMDDPVLLAYLVGFLGMPLARTAARDTRATAAAARVSLDSLRNALTGIGVELPDSDDPDAWARAVVATSPVQRRPWQPTTQPEPHPEPSLDEEPHDGGNADESDILVTHDLLADLFGQQDPGYLANLEQLPVPPDPYAGSLDDLFALDHSPTPADGEVGYTDPTLNDLFSDDENDLESIDVSDLMRDETTGAQEEEIAEPTDEIKHLEASPAGDPVPRVPNGQQLGLPNGDSVRPEFVPGPARPAASRKPATRRGSRVTATPPDSATAPANAVHETVWAHILQHRPVFTSDLTASAVPVEELQDWEQECRQLGTAAPVHFVTPKARHRERGSLILPRDGAPTSTYSSWASSLWGTCAVDRRLRAARLYELAVVLRAHDGKVKSVTVSDSVVTLHVAANRGLVGVVFTMDCDPDTQSASSTAILDAVESMMSQRLTLIAVVSGHGHAEASARLGALLAAARTERSWKVTTPVVTAASWTFKADGGSTMLEALP